MLITNVWISSSISGNPLFYSVISVLLRAKIPCEQLLSNFKNQHIQISGPYIGMVALPLHLSHHYSSLDEDSLNICMIWSICCITPTLNVVVDCNTSLKVDSRNQDGNQESLHSNIGYWNYSKFLKLVDRCKHF